MLTAEVAHKPTLRAVRGRNDRPIVLPGVTVPAPSREEGGQMKSVRHGLVGLVCVPLVLLAACEDGDSKSDEPTPSASPDRTSVVEGKRVSVRVDLGGGGIIKQKNK